MFRRFSIAVFIILCLNLKVGGQIASVYSSPHGDDWQLFMMPSFFHSINNPREKVIILQTTAADQATGPDGEHPFFIAREEGSLRATRFLCNAFGSGEGSGAIMDRDTVLINGHPIYRSRYLNTVTYFLRLPDGNMDGSGYPLYNNVSIEKLYLGEAKEISAINQSTSYESIDDLRTSIRKIVELEMDPADHLVFNIADTDPALNPGDHSDHIYCSKIMQDIAPFFESVTLKLYAEYYTGSPEQNVFDHDYMISIGAWAVTTSGISDFFHISTWDNSHNQWLGREYFRLENMGADPLINIALNKPAIAFVSEDGHPPEHAADGDLNTYWGGFPYPQWWQLDLLGLHEISSIVITPYYDGYRYYHYTIESSADSLSWTKVVDMTTNTDPVTAYGDEFELNKLRSKYIRVNMNSNSVNPGVHIKEFEVYGRPASKSAHKSAVRLMPYPNPVQKGSSVSIEIDSDKEVVARMEVFNIKGLRLSDRQLYLVPGGNILDLSGSNLSTGTNIIRVSFPGFIGTGVVTVLK